MTDERIIAYLLEELPEGESEQFEDECFAAECWPPEINLAEADLIDAYLSNELTEGRRQRFERNYLTTEARRERVRMAAAFLRHIGDCDAPSVATATAAPTVPGWRARFSNFWSNQTRALRAAAVLATVAIIGGAFWLYLARSRQPRSFTTVNPAITIGSTRGESSRAVRVKLPLKDEALKIILELPGGTEPGRIVRASLEKDSGETKTLEIAERNNQFVTVIIPAEQIERGRYLLKLLGRRDDGAEQPINGSYFFTVE
jgi:hypothetical protein